MTDDTTTHQRDDDETVQVHRRHTDGGIRGFIGRNLNWMAYIILTAAIIFALNSVRNESIERREDIIVATQKVIQDSCERGNGTRVILRELILASQPQLDNYLKEGLLTQEQFNRAVKANKAAAAKLPAVDCSAAINQVSGITGVTPTPTP